MSRKKKRNLAAKSRSATAVQEQPKAAASPLERLLDLPQQNASWQVGLRKLDPEQAGDEPCWVLGVADVRCKRMRCLTVIEGNPTPDAVWLEMLTVFCNRSKAIRNGHGGWKCRGPSSAGRGASC